MRVEFSRVLGSCPTPRYLLGSVSAVDEALYDNFLFVVSELDRITGSPDCNRNLISSGILLDVAPGGGLSVPLLTAIGALRVSMGIVWAVVSSVPKMLIK